MHMILSHLLQVQAGKKTLYPLVPADFVHKRRVKINRRKEKERKKERKKEKGKAQQSKDISESDIRWSKSIKEE